MADRTVRVGGASASRPARKRNAQLRFRHNFLSQAGERLREFADLLADTPEARESVAFELRRLSETADTLDLATVGQAAREAAQALEQGVVTDVSEDDTVSIPRLAVAPPVGRRVLRPVANALRHATGPLRFGPLVLVGLEEAHADRVRRDAGITCEPVQVHPDLQSFAGGLHTEPPACVVLPASATDALHQLATRERFVVLAHGGADPGLHLAALEAGAQGVLTGAFALSEVTRLARWRASTARARPGDVLVALDEPEARAELASVFAKVGISVIEGDDAASVVEALERGIPRALVLGSTIGGAPVQPLVRLVRAHPRYSHVPIVVYGSTERIAATLREAGVDDVLRGAGSPAQAVQRVLDRSRRIASLPFRMEPVTGLANRLGALDGLDAALARASRSGEVVSVVLVETAGITDASAQTAGLARRCLADAFGTDLRRTDVVGELDVGELLVVLPGCDREVAVRRVEDAMHTFRQRCREEPELAGLGDYRLGAADTSRQLEGVAPRAELELRTA